MVQSQYSLTWETFKSSVSGGFSSLQQNGELVDMTLAADGHFVKVHQVLMALVSPYLKGLITSAPCQHPVIFLNNVSHQTLGQLLEYVYTGEVMVPHENFDSFIQTGKALHIKGLDDVSQDNNHILPDHKPTRMDESFGNTTRVSGLKRMAAVNDTTTDRSDLPSSAKRIILTRKAHGPFIMKQDQSSGQPDESADYLMAESAHDTDDDVPHADQSQETSVDYTKYPENPVTSIQFSISIRGCLQAILNRYIYNLHSTKMNKGIKRWRCVNYRDHRCQAYLTTKGNVVQNRANLHNHPFHDKKILQKIEKKAIFTALEEAQTYQEEQKKADDENVITTDKVTNTNIQKRESVQQYVTNMDWKLEKKDSDLDV